MADNIRHDARAAEARKDITEAERAAAVHIAANEAINRAPGPSGPAGAPGSSGSSGGSSDSGSSGGSGGGQ